MDTFAEVKKAILKIQPGTDEAKITPEARLNEDLEIDSLSKVEMSLALEDELDLSLLDTELEEIKTVGEVTSLIESKLKVRDV